MAYSSRANRGLLRARRIEAIIPECADQIANRHCKGSAGGRPVGYDVEDYKSRNVVERFFNRMKHWRGVASRYDKHAFDYRGGTGYARSAQCLPQLHPMQLCGLSGRGVRVLSAARGKLAPCRHLKVDSLSTLDTLARPSWGGSTCFQWRTGRRSGGCIGPSGCRSRPSRG